MDKDDNYTHFDILPDKNTYTNVNDHKKSEDQIFCENFGELRSENLPSYEIETHGDNHSQGYNIRQNRSQTFCAEFEREHYYYSLHQIGPKNINKQVGATKRKL